MLVSGRVGVCWKFSEIKKKKLHGEFRVISGILFTPDVGLTLPNSRSHPLSFATRTDADGKSEPNIFGPQLVVVKNEDESTVVSSVKKKHKNKFQVLHPNFGVPIWENLGGPLNGWRIVHPGPSTPPSAGFPPRDAKEASFGSHLGEERTARVCRCSDLDVQ